MADSISEIVNPTTTRGPVITPYLLHRGVRPRYAIGYDNTEEVAVASASAVSLLDS